MEVSHMMISTNRIISITEANQNFSKVAKNAKKFGDTVIFKRNKPAYILFDIEKMGEDFIKEYEKLKLKHISESLLKEYDMAYKELAK
jgi:antitoxin Phd